jgi:hypothetical protein
MRKLPLLSLLVGLFALPSFAAETYKDVSVVDVNCSKKVAADPDAHARACALKCAASGFGIVDASPRVSSRAQKTAPSILMILPSPLHCSN